MGGGQLQPVGALGATEHFWKVQLRGMMPAVCFAESKRGKFRPVAGPDPDTRGLLGGPSLPPSGTLTSPTQQGMPKKASAKARGKEKRDGQSAAEEVRLRGYVTVCRRVTRATH